MGTWKDFTGQIFGTIMADEYIGNGKWKCHCIKCNTEYIKRSTQMIRRQCRKCMKFGINEHFFDSIDTEVKAYILGFLWADGSINKTTGLIKIDTQERDLDILETIKASLEYEGPITSYFVPKGQSYRPRDATVYRLAIVNRALCDELTNKGYCAHRELAPLPLCVPTFLQKHFIRGYFDGNGSISISDDKSVNMNICGGTTIIQEIGSLLQEQIGLVPHYYSRRPDNPNNLTLNINKIDNQYNCLKFLYEHTHIYLNRKYQKYLIALDILESKLQRSSKA